MGFFVFFFLRLYTLLLFSSLPFLFPSPLLPILHFQLSLLLSHVPSILRLLLLLLLFSSFSYVLHEYVHPFSFAAAPSNFFPKTIISKTASKVFGNDGFLFPSFFVALLWKHNLIHFAGLIITFLSLLHLSSTKGQTSAAFHQLTKKKIFFSRLCQSPFLHPWPFFVFDHGRLTPLAFLLSFYHHLSTYYLREEKSTIITW